MSNINVQTTIKKVQDKIKALKCTQAVSGSLVQYKVLTSSTYTAQTTDQIYKFRATFAPLVDMEQNDFTKLYLHIKDTISIMQISTSSETTVRDSGLKDSNGNLYVEGYVQLQSPAGLHNYEVYAIAAGPANGSFAITWDVL